MPAAALAPAVADPPLEDSTPSGTRRPRLLISAARHGLADYRRQRDLPRLIDPATAPADIPAALAALEERMENARRDGDPSWSCLRHVEVLIALLAERAMRAE